MDEKQKLIELIRKAGQEETKFIATLTDDDRSAVGSSHSWAVKDQFAHIAAWVEVMSHRFMAASGEQEPPPAYDDLNDFNEQLFQRHRGKTWQEVLDYLDLANSQLLEQVHQVDEQNLVDAERYPWLGGRSLWKRTIHNGYYHPMGHIAALYHERGEETLGNQLMEAVTQELLDLDASTSWQGQTLYNLACFYALNGESEKSLENLAQAFSLAPDIIEWSQKDTDLESLWQDPRFLALVDRAGG